MTATRFSAPAETVADLVGRARQGDRGAFAELYRTHTRLVHGVLLSRIPSSDVDDLVQDVFMLAMERLGTLRDLTAFGAWLAAIARSRAIDHLRRQLPTTELVDDIAVNDPDRSEIIAVMAAIRRLPLAYRETLTLRLVEGMTGHEIAERTGLTDGSVRVNLHRGMKQLKEELEGAAHETAR